MRYSTFIVLLAAVLLCSCAAKKRLTTPVQPETAWHTANVTNTMLELTLGDQIYVAPCQMQTVRDSMIVISLMPVMNMEMLRIEIQPDTAYIIDKMNRRYTRVPMNRARKAVTPPLRWEDLQSFAAGEVLQPDQSLTLGYSYGAYTVRLKAAYGEIKYDAPVNMRRLRLDRYSFVDINTLLP